MFNALIITMMLSMGSYNPGGKMLRAIWMERTVNALVEDATLQKEVGLSEEQLGKIRDVKFSTDKEIVNLKSKLELKEVDLREELSKDAPDMKRVEDLIRAKHSIMADIEIAKVKEYTTLRSILTPEQIDKLKEVMRNRAEGRMRGLKERPRRKMPR